jgi:hypothetical protein
MSFDIGAAERCKRPGLWPRSEEAHKRAKRVDKLLLHMRRPGMAGVPQMQEQFAAGTPAIHGGRRYGL